MIALWVLVEADFHSEYGIDLHAGVLRRRPASWLIARVVGLITTDSRLSRALHAQREG